MFKKILQVVPLVIVFAVAYRLFLPYEILLIVGRSMEPTLSENSIELVRKSEIQVNSIVVVQSPAAWKINKKIVKRAAGFGGDHIKLSNGKLYINQQLYLEDSSIEVDLDFTVPIGKLFVIGDNFPYSNDSLQYLLTTNDISNSFVELSTVDFAFKKERK